MTFSLGEYQDIFLEEADEQLQELNQNLLELEKNPEDLDIINNIFRAAHSLKSSAAFVGLNDLSDLAHKMENLLQGIRDRTLGVTPDIVDIIFKCFDVINSVIDSVSSGEEPKQDISWLIEDIQNISNNSASSNSGQKLEKKQNSDDSTVPKTELSNDNRLAIKNGIDSGQYCYEITVFIEENAQMKWVKAQLVLNNLDRLGTVIKTFPSAEDLNDDDMNNVFKVIVLSSQNLDKIKSACDVDLIVQIDIRNIVVAEQNGKKTIKLTSKESFFTNDIVEVTPKASRETLEVIEEDSIEEIDDHIIDVPVTHDNDRRAADKVDHDKVRSITLKTVKVSIDKLDQLLNNVGELVIANSGFYKLYEEIRKTTADKTIANEFKNRMEGMSRIAKDLQTGIMKTRMVPIGQVFNRFNRTIRDLSKEYDKNIELVIKGEDTELDKKVIDSINEPLMHLVRNAVDHGIEDSQERAKAGKPDLAYVTFNAYQGGNQIFVEVSDDGRGLNLDVIKRKIVEKGLASIEQLVNMDDADIYNYIFHPGFSTASVVTDISGRGVGMNVVKEIVGELNGNVSIETEQGMGTRFVLTFPLTLAIIPAIMVRVQKEVYAIPLSDVIETIKIAQADITTIEGHEVLNFRGEILSLLRLSKFIRTDSALTEDQKIPVVVVGFGNRKIGLMVDYLEGKLEIVIKSLEQNYKTVEGLAGASILGDGSICLILDIAAMINKVITDQDKMTHVERDRLLRAPEVKPHSIISPEETAQMQMSEGKGSGTLVFEDFEEDDSDEVVDIEQESSSVPVEDVDDSTPLESVIRTESKSESFDIKEDTVPANEPIQVSDIVKESTLDSEIKTQSKIEEKSPVDRTPVETTPVQKAAEEDNEVVDKKVQDALDSFRNELKENIKSSLDAPTPGSMTEKLNITDEDLREFQVLANIGAANAAESLSKIIGKSISLSIPEVAVKATEQIPQYLGDIDSTYMGVLLPILEDLRGTVLFILHEEVGFKLIDMLYDKKNESKKLDEDGESALNEITNIVGSSVINVFAEKSLLSIKPGLPTIVHDYMQSILDSVLVVQNLANDYTIVMDTAFFFEDDRVVGNLLVIPETDTFKNLIDKMRSNG